MKQLGESEYLKLSEQERQRRLALLKLQERRLTKEGVSKLLSFFTILVLYVFTCFSV